MREFGENVKITAMDNKLLTEHPEIIGLLQKAYSNEYLAWLVYEHSVHFVFGPWRESIIDHFEAHAKDEEDHAEWIGGRLSALGEAPVLDMKVLKRVTSVSSDYVELLEFIMQLEGEAVALYSSMLPSLENHAAMRNTVEGYIEAEQEHFEDFEKMIRMLPELEHDEAHEDHSQTQEPEKNTPDK